MKKILLGCSIAGSIAFACGNADNRPPADSDTINNDSTRQTDTGYMRPEDSANNAKYIQPNSANPPKSPEQH